MFCRNCGKENTDESKVCKFCGQDLIKPVLENNRWKAVESTANTKKSKKTKIIIISVILILVLLSVCALFFMFKTTTPDIEQLKSDFTSEVLKDDKCSITEFKILSETDEKNDQYKAVVEIVYDNTKIECHRKYEFSYNKYKEWNLVDIDCYAKDSWQIVPIAAPVAKDYEEECKEHIMNEYDKFAPVESKTTSDLNSGKATFVFSVAKSTKIQNITGEIEFNYVFNDAIGIWEYNNYSYADSYSEQYNLINTWSGDGYPYLLTESEDYKVTFVFEITKYKNDTVEGVLKYDNKSYDLKGKIYDTSSNSIDLDLLNSKEKKYINLSIQFDGNVQADINTNYSPNQIVYFGYEMSQYKDVEMSLR